MTLTFNILNTSLAQHVHVPLVPCHALHVPQHVAVSLSEPLNQVISSAPSTETVFAYLD